MCVTSWFMWTTSTMNQEPYKTWILPPNSQHRCQHSYLKSLLVEVGYFRSCLTCHLSSSKIKKSCLVLNAKLSILGCSAAFPNAFSKDLHEITFSPQHSPLCTGALLIFSEWHFIQALLFLWLQVSHGVRNTCFSALIVLLHKQRNKSLAGHLVLLLLFLPAFILCHDMLSLKRRQCFSQQSLFKYNFITWSYWNQGLSQALQNMNSHGIVLSPEAWIKDVENCQPGFAMDSSVRQMQRHPPRVDLSRSTFKDGTDCGHGRSALELHTGTELWGPGTWITRASSPLAAHQLETSAAVMGPVHVYSLPGTQQQSELELGNDSIWYLGQPWHQPA